MTSCAACQGTRTPTARSSARSAVARSLSRARRAATHTLRVTGSAVNVARRWELRGRGRGGGAGRRAPARLGAVRRPGRLHDALGVARRRGGARAPLALLRHLPPADRALRRHGREVHRRRGDGGVGDADGDRGRRRARGAGRARPRRGGLGARRRGRRAGAARAGRRADRRGGGDDRRRGPGHGRRRPRQHGLAHPVGRRARHGARRRGDAPRDRADDRLRGRRRARAEGQGRAGAALAGAAGRLGRPRLAQVDRGSRRRSSAATASCARSRISSTRAPTGARRTSSRSTGIAGIGKSRLAWEFYKYFDGLAADSRTGIAAAASPTARASRTGRSPTWCACAAGSPRTRSRPSALEKLHGDARGAHRRRRRSGRSSSRGSRSCSASREHAARDKQDLFAAWRLFFERLADVVPDRARVRGHAVGGREPARLRRVPARVVAQLAALRDHARPAGAGRAATDLGRRPPQLHVALPRAAVRERDGGAARGARARAARATCASRSSPAPRASRCTRSRRCGCCSTAACSSRRARLPAVGGDRRRSRCRRRCTR